MEITYQKYSIEKGVLKVGKGIDIKYDYPVDSRCEIVFRGSYPYIVNPISRTCIKDIVTPILDVESCVINTSIDQLPIIRQAVNVLPVYFKFDEGDEVVGKIVKKNDSDVLMTITTHDIELYVNGERDKSYLKFMPGLIMKLKPGQAVNMVLKVEFASSLSRGLKPGAELFNPCRSRITYKGNEFPVDITLHVGGYGYFNEVELVGMGCGVLIDRLSELGGMVEKMEDGRIQIYVESDGYVKFKDYMEYLERYIVKTRDEKVLLTNDSNELKLLLECSMGKKEFVGIVEEYVAVYEKIRKGIYKYLKKDPDPVVVNRKTKASKKY